MGRRRRPGARVRGRRRRCGRVRRGRRRACRAAGRAPAAAPRYSSGCARPSSIASSMAVIDATGVRRSWLAAAMSSRRASKRLSSSEAIALNELPSCASSRGPPVGARTVRSPCASRSADALSFSSGRVIDAASTSATATALAAAAGRDGEDLHVGAHVEHHPARQQHGRKRQEDGKQPERGELRPHRRQPAQAQPRQAGRRRASRERRRSRDESRNEPVADAPERLETLRG